MSSIIWLMPTVIWMNMATCTTSFLMRIIGKRISVLDCKSSAVRLYSTDRYSLACPASSWFSETVRL